MTRPSRASARASFDTDTRVALAEGDLDTFDAALADLKKSMSRLTAALFSAAFTVATSTIVLAITITST